MGLSKAQGNLFISDIYTLWLHSPLRFGDTCSSCQCWAWRQHRCSDNAARLGLGPQLGNNTSCPSPRPENTQPALKARFCSQASPSNTPLPVSLPPGLAAPLLQHSSLLSPQETPHPQSLLQLFSYSPSSPHVFLSISTLVFPPHLAPPSAAPCSAHRKAALCPSGEAQSQCLETPPQQTRCFHHDAVP